MSLSNSSSAIRNVENVRCREQIRKYSMNQIILSIRRKRDRQIMQLMNEEALVNFLEYQGLAATLSPIKAAFLKRELIELKNSPLDLSFYSSLITKMKEADTCMVEINHHLLLTELKAVVSKYLI